MRKAIYLGILSIVVTMAGACDSERPLGLEGPSTAVIDGAEHPDELGFEINELEMGAVGGQRVEMGGEIYQGCSGTLAGDRLVVTAAHCVVQNQEDWMGGAAAELVSTATWELGTGVDIADPDCLFHAEEILIHPSMENGALSFDHDMALVVLDESVIETCPGAVPIPINREAVLDEMIGEAWLQGGFGSLDGTYDFSPIRYWSLLDHAGFSDTILAMHDMGDGFPTFGDSGSGVLRRWEDGSLRTMGVASRSGSGGMIFTRLDAVGEFIDSVATSDVLCGPITAEGKCIDEFYVACDEYGFTSIDCTQEDCPLPCPCECDTSLECDGQDCQCDPECEQEAPVEDGGVEDNDHGGGGDCSVGPDPGGRAKSSLVVRLLPAVFL